MRGDLLHERDGIASVWVGIATAEAEYADAPMRRVSGNQQVTVRRVPNESERVPSGARTSGTTDVRCVSHATAPDPSR